MKDSRQLALMTGLGLATFLPSQEANAQRTKSNDPYHNRFGIGWINRADNGLFSSGNQFHVQGIYNLGNEGFWQNFRLTAGYITGNKKIGFSNQFTFNNPWWGQRNVQASMSWRPAEAYGGLEIGPNIELGDGGHYVLTPYIGGTLRNYPGFAQNFANFSSTGQHAGVRFFMGMPGEGRNSGWGLEGHVSISRENYRENFFNRAFGVFGPNVNYTPEWGLNFGVNIIIGTGNSYKNRPSAQGHINHYDATSYSVRPVQKLYHENTSGIIAPLGSIETYADAKILNNGSDTAVWLGDTYIDTNRTMQEGDKVFYDQNVLGLVTVETPKITDAYGNVISSDQPGPSIITLG